MPDLAALAPWSQITAYDLNTGTIKWQIPDGGVNALAEQGHSNTGALVPLRCRWGSTALHPARPLACHRAGTTMPRVQYPARNYGDDASEGCTGCII